MLNSSRFPLSVVITESFKKDYQIFIRGNNILDKKLSRYIDFIRHGRTCSGMNLEKINGFESIKGLKSVRLNDEIRISIIISDKLFLLRINHHDALYKNPT